MDRCHDDIPLVDTRVFGVILLNKLFQGEPFTVDFKNKLRRRLLGRRFQQQILDAQVALKNLGNRNYQTGEHNLLAPGYNPSINAYEFSVYSQNGEDGVILSLLSRVGVETRYIVEIGTEDGRECNSANLILNFGWRGCLFEANKKSSDSARAYFSDCLGANSDRVCLINATVSPDNINQLLRSHDVPVPIDVLSMDIDSYEYWVWKAIDYVIPRLVVIEYNASFGPERAVTIHTDLWRSRRRRGSNIITVLPSPRWSDSVNKRVMSCWGVKARGSTRFLCAGN